MASELSLVALAVMKTNMRLIIITTVDVWHRAEFPSAYLAALILLLEKQSLQLLVLKIIYRLKSRF